MPKSSKWSIRFRFSNRIFLHISHLPLPHFIFLHLIIIVIDDDFLFNLSNYTRCFGRTYNINSIFTLS
jgi:hypothetical protein